MLIYATLHLLSYKHPHFQKFKSNWTNWLYCSYSFRYSCFNIKCYYNIKQGLNMLFFCCNFSTANAKLTAGSLRYKNPACVRQLMDHSSLHSTLQYSNFESLSLQKILKFFKRYEMVTYNNNNCAVLKQS